MHKIIHACDKLCVRGCYGKSPRFRGPGYDLRLISTQENYPWIGTDKKIFLCVKVISSNPELTRQRKIFLSVPTTDNFPKWKLASNVHQFKLSGTLVVHKTPKFAPNGFNFLYTPCNSFGYLVRN
jgi:hypothetical protein